MLRSDSTVRLSTRQHYLLSIVESTEPKQVYGVKLDFVSERTIKEDRSEALPDSVAYCLLNVYLMCAECVPSVYLTY